MGGGGGAYLGNGGKCICVRNKTRRIARRPFRELSRLCEQSQGSEKVRPLLIREKKWLLNWRHGPARSAEQSCGAGPDRFRLSSLQDQKSPFDSWEGNSSMAQSLVAKQRAIDPNDYECMHKCIPQNDEVNRITQS